MNNENKFIICSTWQEYALSKRTMIEQKEKDKYTFHSFKIHMQWWNNVNLYTELDFLILVRETSRLLNYLFTFGINSGIAIPKEFRHTVLYGWQTREV